LHILKLPSGRQMPVLWFWSRIISPHMAALAVALGRRGCAVTYVAEEPMSRERLRTGWATPALPGITLLIMSTADAAAQFALGAPKDAVHITQGVRSNGLVGNAQRQLESDGRSYWVVMEKVDEFGWCKFFKRLVYRNVFWRRRRCLAGVLAIGRGTDRWVRARGVPGSKIFKFAYFLSEPAADSVAPASDVALDLTPFKVIFVGRLIALKRVDLLIQALAELPAALASNVHLTIVGDGPLESSLRELAERRLGDRVEWKGRLSMGDARREMNRADCLVLPSRHDGWGAVVSEALMAGVPAISSDACGASEVILASGVGGVFHDGDVAALSRLLARHIAAGPISNDARLKLAHWGRRLGGDAGAVYLLEVLARTHAVGARPVPPWNLAG